LHRHGVGIALHHHVAGLVHLAHLGLWADRTGSARPCGFGCPAAAPERPELIHCRSAVLRHEEGPRPHLRWSGAWNCLRNLVG
jgi:hypothetical protein